MPVHAGHPDRIRETGLNLKLALVRNPHRGAVSLTDGLELDENRSPAGRASKGTGHC